MTLILPLKLRGDRIGVGLIGVTLQLGKATAVVRHQAPGRLLHLFKIKVMHTRLVKDHMRQVRQAFLPIRHTPAAHNAAGVCTRSIIRLPKGGLIDPIGLFQDTVGKPEGFKHFHRAAGNAVGLTQLQRAGLLLHDDGADVWESGQLSG